MIGCPHSYRSVRKRKASRTAMKPSLIALICPRIPVPARGPRYARGKRCYGVEFYYVDRTLVPFFGRLRLKEITPTQVDRFKDRRLEDGLKKSSINREIGLLKSMLNRAVKWGLIGAHPAKDVELFELDDTSVSDRVLSTEEEAKVLAACDESELRYRAPHLKHVVLVRCSAGLRRGEILRLRWSDIDFEKGRLSVRKSKTKSGKREVYLNSMLHQQLFSLSKRVHGEGVFPSPARFQKPDNLSDISEM